jgi:acyl-CoA synthetase (AMP-forming)/AMP-acid ligase II
LQTHPAVLEAAIVGVPDPRWGEALLAFVVPRRNHRLTPGELATHCRITLSDYKVPKEFRVLDSLPRNAGGKVMKNDLRQSANE